ncbi:PREDICTED: carotenoid isomerooxygenase isoform X1 [Eufriesea mexicana]|uniref:carotenoid isomerooxygenase isoform X1 n=1 Tax=Eufriesea mexicana TaxID=516756 RepID=UPI00083BC984|nr:PREDICTED: carotenoid isomerooxygenase isoform X1 [Eufriesea mexicana]
MKSSSRSRSENDFSSVKLHELDDLLYGKRMKFSKTSFRLNDVEDCVKTDKNESEEKKENYFPNCDASVWMRSCKKEVIEPITGELTGKIPSWLKGTLLRNGPGSLQVGEYSFNHLFDSSALLHRFAIVNGNVTYQCRFVQTDVYKKNNAAQRIVVTEFGTKAVPDPCKSIFQRVAAVFKPENDSDNSMISVYPFSDEYYTFTESAMIHRIDPKTLETTGKVNVSNYVGIVNHTSHPHIMSDGTVYNMGLSVTPRGPLYNVVCFSPSRIVIDDSGEEKELSMFDQATIVASVPSRWLLNPSYMHTFGITENYFIIVEQPLAVSLTTVVSCKMKQQPMCAALKWYENENTLIHVVSRDTGLLERTFISEAFFYLHIINQFETRDRDYVVLDICCYRDAKMLDCLFVDAMKNLHKNPDYAKMFRGRPLRFVLPMKYPRSDVPLEYNLITAKTVNQGLESFQDNSDRCENKSGSEFIESSNEIPDKVTKAKRNDYKNILQRRAAAHRLANGNIFVKPELLCDLGCETPRINYEFYLGNEYRYFYAISSDVDLENPGTIIKVDILKKTRKTWCEKNVYPSEPVFVPDPRGKNEDDGVVLSSIVWSDKETRVGLLILDGVTLTEIARATFETPGPVPKCLHGWFTLDK